MMFAIVDLGSNSFKLEFSRVTPSGFKRVEAFKMPVRFVSGLDEQGRLDAATRNAALGCLTSFNAHIGRVAPDRSIAVATESFRRLHPSNAFIDEATRALGLEIKILTGEEEARYCYQGVAATLGPAQAPRLVMDVGGGSTQIILGDASGVTSAISVPLGCVVFTKERFADGRFSAAQFSEAVEAARAIYAPAAKYVSAQQARSWIGASGAFRTVLEAGASKDSDEKAITRRSIDTICDSLFARGYFDPTDFPNVPTDRHVVFVACVALTLALLDVTGADAITVCKSGIRAGLLDHLLLRAQLASL
jgi:exopolyphosphatase / guanosine-5'-triphosphate,3'-diphosphate pyrophosphatase